MLRKIPSAQAPRSLVLVAMLVLLTGSGASADYRENYQQAIEAMNAENWSGMTLLLRMAIAEHPESGGGRMRRAGGYFPHYHLGIALQEQGECSEALETWSESTRQGVLARAAPALQADLVSRRRRCEKTLQEFAQRSEDAFRLLDKSSRLAQELRRRRGDPQLADAWQAGEVPLSDRLVRLAVQLDSIAATLNGDTLSTSIHRTLLDLREIEKGLLDIESELSILTVESAGENEDLKESLGRARVLLEAQIEEMLSYPIIRETSRNLATLLTAAEQAESLTPEETTELMERLSTAVKALELATVPPPNLLSEAAEAFVVGDYEEVLDLLEGADRWTAFRSRAHICLMRSASFHSLYLRSGETRPELLEQATELLAGCPFLENHVTLSSSLLSPAFLDFYRLSRESSSRD